MDVVINFWDSEKGCVNTKYLTSAFLGTSTAEDFLRSVMRCINESNLSLDKLVQVATDGPNVNLKLLFDINTYMKTTIPSEKQILNIGTCSLHIVNGAYKTAHNKSRLDSKPVFKATVQTIQKFSIQAFHLHPRNRLFYISTEVLRNTVD